MDLKRLSPRAAAEKGAAHHLKDPATGEPLYADGEPVKITVKGAHSVTAKEKRKEIERRRLEGEEVTHAQEGAEMLAAVTVAWEGIGFGSTDNFPCTFENAVTLYLDPDTDWIVDQIGPFSIAPRNFVQNRPKG